jgi:hypothetical protein
MNLCAIRVASALISISMSSEFFGPFYLFARFHDFSLEKYMAARFGHCELLVSPGGFGDFVYSLRHVFGQDAVACDARD